MSHDCIAGSSVQLIEVNTIEVFFFCNDRTDQWRPGEGLGGKNVFLETEFSPLSKGLDERPPTPPPPPLSQGMDPVLRTRLKIPKQFQLRS